MPILHVLKRDMLVLSLPIFLSSLSASITNIAVPSLIYAFDASLAQIQWVIIAYLITLTSAAILMGSIGDRVDRRGILLCCLGLFLFSSLLCGWSSTVNQLIGYRILQGIAAAGMMNTTMALITELNRGINGALNTNKGGFTMGVVGSLSALGTAAGPSVGGWLISFWSWQAIFLINIPLTLIALFLVIRFIPRQPVTSTPPHPFDILGVFFLTSAIVIYTFSIVNWGSYSPLFIAVSLLSVVVFVVIEKNLTHPAISIALLTQPTLLIGSLLNLLVATVMMTTLIVGPFYLLNKLALTPWQMGAVMSCGPMVAACLGVPAGKLVDKSNPNYVIRYALIFMLLGFTLLAIFAHHLSIILYIIFIVVITSGYAAFQAANNTAILFGVNSNQKSLLAGIINLSRNLGLINGAALMTTLFAYAAGHSINTIMRPTQVADGFRLTFAISAALMLIALTLLAFYQRYTAIKITCSCSEKPI